MSHWAEDGGSSAWKPAGNKGQSSPEKQPEEKKNPKPDDNGDGDGEDAGGGDADGGGDAGGGGGDAGGGGGDAGGGGGGGGGSGDAGADLGTAPAKESGPKEPGGKEKPEEAAAPGQGPPAASGGADGSAAAATAGASSASGEMSIADKAGGAVATPAAAPADMAGSAGGPGAKADAAGGAPPAPMGEAAAEKLEAKTAEASDAASSAKEPAVAAKDAGTAEGAAAKIAEPGVEQAGGFKKAMSACADEARTQPIVNPAAELEKKNSDVETAAPADKPSEIPHKEMLESAALTGKPAALHQKEKTPEAAPADKAKEQTPEVAPADKAKEQTPEAAPAGKAAELSQKEKPQKTVPTGKAHAQAAAPGYEAVELTQQEKAREAAPADNAAEHAQKGKFDAKAGPGVQSSASGDSEAKESKQAVSAGGGGGEKGATAGGGIDAKAEKGGGAEAKAAKGDEGGGEGSKATQGAAHGGGSGHGGGGGGSGGGGSGAAQGDPGFQAVKGRVASAAKTSSAHGPAKGKADEAGAAAVPPGNEVESQAQGRQVGEMAAEQPQPFNRAGFLAALRDRIAQTAPKNLEEANDFKNNNNLAAVKEGVTDKVREGKEQAEGNLKKKAQEPPSTAGITPKPVTPLKLEGPGSGPPKVGAAQAMPKPKPESDVTLKPQSQKIDEKMAEADLTEPQLQKSNESKFQAVITSKKAAQADAEARPPAYRQQEQGVLAGAQGQAEGMSQGKLQEMHGHRGQLLSQVLGKQEGAKQTDEKARAEVAAHIQQIYQSCKQKLEARLARLDGEVKAAFDQGTATAKTQFESYVGQRMDAYKEERYSGLIGKGRWVKDKLFGMPSEVNAFYSQGRNQYLAAMEATIEKVATIVETGLREAQTELARGKKEVQQYVSSLPANLQKVGQQAAQEIQAQFSQLEQSISDKEGELIDSLAQKYNDSLQQIDQRIQEMKAANRGLVDKALDAIKGVYETIKQLKDLLLGVLSRAAGVIGKILKDPIGFVGNLVAGAKAGFQGFVSRIGEHLQKGLLGWLTGALGEAGIQMPASFDLKGILGLVMQVMGVTYQAIRTRAVKMFGEKAVQALEKGSEIFKLLISGGPMAVWEHIKDKIGDLKEQIIGQIQSFIINKVIQAGVTWVLSLLNPASAFIRACKAIYDIVMFFIERAAQIVELVNAVLDSIESVASGAVGAMAAKIEAALAKAIPVVISFLASVLGLGGISTKIRSIIQKVQAPIQKGIDWVLKKAYDLVKKAGGFLKGAFSGKDKDKDKDKDKKVSEKEQQGANKKDDKPGDGQQTGKEAEQAKEKPVVEVPFDMAGASHELTFKPQAGGGVEVLMASSQQLPLSKKFQAAHTALDNFRHYATSIKEPTVKAHFQTQLLPKIKEVQSSMVSTFKDLYKGCFPGKDKSPTLTEEAAKKQVDVLIKQAEKLLAELRRWGAETGITDLSAEAVDATLREKGDQIWRDEWQRTKAEVTATINGFMYKGQKVQYKGSVMDGWRGPHKGKTHFDATDFDVDLYVVHPEEYDKALKAGAKEVYGKIFPTHLTRELSTLSEKIVDALKSRFPQVERIGSSSVALRKF